MNDLHEAFTAKKPTSWRWLVLGPAIVLLILYGYFKLTSSQHRSYLHIFPTGFTGPNKILLDPNAPPLGRSKGAWVLRYGSAGLVTVNRDDFEDLARWSHHEYRYVDGKPINLYIPHTGQVTHGPWIELLPRESVTLGGRELAEQSLNARIGTMTR